MIDLDELKVPVAMRPIVDEIVRMTDVVCEAVLDEEYAELARRATAKLARKRPSPLASGRRTTWAAGILYALGQVNYLSDPSSEPYLTADELSKGFGIAKATMGTKAKLVRDLGTEQPQVGTEAVRATPEGHRGRSFLGRNDIREAPRRQFGAAGLAKGKGIQAGAKLSNKL